MVVRGTSAVGAPPQPQPPASVRVGVDVVDVRTVGDALARFGDDYVRRVFTEHEAAEVAEDAPEVRAQRLAARFAVKEATLKVLPVAADGHPWHDIELRRDERGAPQLALGGPLLAAASAAGLGGWSVSISHDAGIAVAVVVAGPPAA